MAGKNIKGITIEFNGDTKKLDKALREVNKESKDIDKELKEVNKALKFNPGNVTLTQQKMELLKQKVDTTKNQLKEYQQIQKNLSAEGVEKNSAEWREVERKIIEAESKVKHFEAQLKSMETTKLDELKRKAKEVGDSFKDIGGKIENVGSNMSMRVTAPIVGGFAYAAKAASDFEENLNKVDVAFGDSAGEVTKWADTATEKFGLSKNSALEAASLFGDMGTSMGLTQKDAAGMAMSLSGLAGDLSSFKNIDVEQAMTALKGVFTGETESLKELGVVMTQDNLKQFAADAGLVYDEMSEAEKVQLRYNYVLSKTKNAQGDYANTSDGTANSIRTFKESLNNLAIVIGQEILPVITPIIQKMGEWIQKFSEMSPASKKMIVVIGAVIASIGPLLVIIGTVISAIGSIMTVLGGLGIAALGPIGIVIGIITALIAVIVLCVKHWNGLKAGVLKVIGVMKKAVNNFTIMFRKKISDMILSVKAKINQAKSLLRSFGDTTKKVFKAVVNGITAPYRKAWNLIKNIISKIKGLFPFHVKLPHLTIQPWGWSPVDILSGVIPSIGLDWYKNGGVFSSPTIAGIGEAGPEAVVPLDRFWNQMDQMTASIVDGVRMGMSMAAAPGQINITVELGGTKVGEEIVRLYDRTKKAVG